MAHLVPRLELRELRYQWARTWQDKFQHYGLSLPSWANQQVPLAMPCYNQESEGPAITSIRVEDSQVLAAGGNYSGGWISRDYWVRVFLIFRKCLESAMQATTSGHRKSFSVWRARIVSYVQHSSTWTWKIPKVADLQRCFFLKRGSHLSFVLGVGPQKARSFMIKTRVVWVPGIVKI